MKIKELATIAIATTLLGGSVMRPNQENDSKSLAPTGNMRRSGGPELIANSDAQLTARAPEEFCGFISANRQYEYIDASILFKSVGPPIYILVINPDGSPAIVPNRFYLAENPEESSLYSELSWLLINLYLPDFVNDTMEIDWEQEFQHIDLSSFDARRIIPGFISLISDVAPYLEEGEFNRLLENIRSSLPYLPPEINVSEFDTELTTLERNLIENSVIGSITQELPIYNELSQQVFRERWEALAPGLGLNDRTLELLATHPIHAGTEHPSASTGENLTGSITVSYVFDSEGTPFIRKDVTWHEIAHEVQNQTGRWYQPSDLVVEIITDNDPISFDNENDQETINRTGYYFDFAIALLTYVHSPNPSMPEFNSALYWLLYGKKNPALPSQGYAGLLLDEEGRPITLSTFDPYSFSERRADHTSIEMAVGEVYAELYRTASCYPGFIEEPPAALAPFFEETFDTYGYPTYSIIQEP